VSQTQRYVLGLDLGPPGESTGLAIIEYPVVRHYAPKPVYQVRHLQRFAIGTSYPAIFEAVMVCLPNLGRPTLVVNQTAVGTVVIRQLRQMRGAASVLAVTLAPGGAARAGHDGSTRLPKKELITGLQLVFQTRRLKIAPTLPDAELLSRELASYRMRAVMLDDASVQWRDGRNDDLVFAVGLAVWHAERTPSAGFAPYVHGGGDCFSLHSNGGRFIA